MSISIQSINLKDQEKIDYRTIDLSDGRLVQSVNINQTDGSFVTTEPLENNGQIVVYPQSPNNPRYTINTYKTMGEYDDLDMPLDARFDSVRRKLWIADAGGSRILKLNINDYSVEAEINDIIIPHSIVPETNLGGVFVKAFSGINTGVIYYYSSNGTLIDYFTYPCTLGQSTTEVTYTSEFVRSLPIPSTMVYDHVRWRLWWTSGSYVYTIDIRNRQVIQNNLYPEYTETRGMDVELGTGNAFVVAKKQSDWYLVQLFRDNNYNFCDAYILQTSMG